MRVALASPVRITLDRRGSACAVLARVDVWMAAGASWQSAGVAVFQDIAKDSESEAIVLAPGNYHVVVTLSVGQNKTSGTYGYVLLAGDQQVVIGSGSISASSATDDGQAYGAEFDLTVS